VVPPKRRIDLFALGGTIAMKSTDNGAVPSVTAEELVGTAADFANGYEIVPHVVRQTASANISYEDIAELAALILRSVAAGSEGIVVTQGTDTLEETAFALDLLVETPVPVVVTGAMRHASATSGDGAANLVSALCVAGDSSAAGLGVVVVLNEEIHAAKFVRKMHTHKTSAFASPSLGPLGWIMENRAYIHLQPRKPTPKLSYGAGRPFVPVIICAFGMSTRDVASFANDNPDGAVIAAMGCGHIPEMVVPEIEKLAREVPVILASRIGAGELCRSTYGSSGAEIDLLKRGLIPAGSLDSLKARVLLSILLSDGADRSRAASVFADF